MFVGHRNTTCGLPPLLSFLLSYFFLLFEAFCKKLHQKLLGDTSYLYTFATPYISNPSTRVPLRHLFVKSRSFLSLFCKKATQKTFRRNCVSLLHLLYPIRESWEFGVFRDKVLNKPLAPQAHHNSQFSIFNSQFPI